MKRPNHLSEIDIPTTIQTLEGGDGKVRVGVAIVRGDIKLQINIEMAATATPEWVARVVREVACTIMGEDYLNGRR